MDSYFEWQDGAEVPSDSSVMFHPCFKNSKIVLFDSTKTLSDNGFSFKLRALSYLKRGLKNKFLIIN